MVVERPHVYATEQLLKTRLMRYDTSHVQTALEKGKIDLAVAIKVVPLATDTVGTVTIQDSGAVVSAGTRVNAHFHSGGHDESQRDLRGLEVYRVLDGKGSVSLGYPVKEGDELVRDESGNVKVTYEEPREVHTGDFITVLPGQVHSLKNEGETDLIFVFTGSPDHLQNDGDRTIVANPK